MTLGYRDILFNVPSNYEWFLRNEIICEYFNEDYIPSFEDYVRLRSELNYIFDEKSSLNQTWKLQVTDVCGKRSQRPSWASAMVTNTYTAILFTVGKILYIRFLFFFYFIFFLHTHTHRYKHKSQIQ